MPLTAGAKLGSYEILSPLGAGGMGEVYRARDTRLDRTVAIKVLPEQFSQNPDLRQRFEREARAISALNHPNICTLYDVGHQDGVDYLVLEYIEGESLSARLMRGPLPVEQTLKTGCEIAEALEKAHRQGIVHRDLKPGNVMLTKSGAKLLDFGLAKPQGAMQPGSVLTQAITQTSPASPITQQGMLVGTFQYMAPEQVEGKEADARSDIFALGAVLYEMATGKRAFEGKSAISVASAILEKEPEPISKVQPLTPPALEHVVKTCLAKDAEQRWQSAADVARQLRWISEGGSQAGVAPPVAGRRKRRERMVWAGAVLLLLLALVGSYFYWRPPPAVVRASLPAPAGTSYFFTGDNGGPPLVSPDGKRVAFVATTSKGERALWVRPLDSGTAQQLEGTVGAAFPFWSQDSRFVGFFAEGKLKKVAITGAPVTTLADAPNARGGSWCSSDVILYAPDFRDAIWQVSAEGGTGTRVTTLDASKHTTHRWPWCLPDGKHFLYFATNHAGGAPEQNGIYFASRDGKSNRLVLATDSGGQYAEGYLLFHSQKALMAQRMDAGSGRLSGEPVFVAENVLYDPGVWWTEFSAAPGVLVYQEAGAAQGSDLLWYDRAGISTGKVGERDRQLDPRLSPDGKRLVVALGDPLPSIWVIDLERGVKTRLTFDAATNFAPSWSPDGQRVVYSSVAGTLGTIGAVIRQKNADGSGSEEVLLKPSEPGASYDYPQWSPDGRYLLYLRGAGPTGGTVWAVDLKGDRKPFAVAKPQSPQATVVTYRLSPDGRWLAYSSTDSGQEQVYVTSFPSGNGRWQISDQSSTAPAWRGDSRELYYLGLDSVLRAVEVEGKGDSFRVLKENQLFRSVPIVQGSPYDVTRDGKRFLVNSLPGDTSTPMSLVVNWEAEVKK